MAIRPSVLYVDPLTLLEDVERKTALIPAERLFNPECKKLRESWCASMFGIGYATRIDPACQVGVNGTTQRMDADFFLMTGNQKWDFQLAEAQELGRRRGDEYKLFASGKRRTVGCDPDRVTVDGAVLLEDTLHRKKAKHYAGSAQLNILLYANFRRDVHHDQLVAQFGCFANDFASLWIVTSDHLCSIFSTNGLPEIPGWWKFRERRAGI
jgi:hypothetical protein